MNRSFRTRSRVGLRSLKSGGASVRTGTFGPAAAQLRKHRSVGSPLALPLNTASQTKELGNVSIIEPPSKFFSRRGHPARLCDSLDRSPWQAWSRGRSDSEFVVGLPSARERAGTQGLPSRGVPLEGRGGRVRTRGVCGRRGARREGTGGRSSPGRRAARGGRGSQLCLWEHLSRAGQLEMRLGFLLLGICFRK